MFIFALISALASATSAFSADNNDAAVERELQAQQTQQTRIEAPAQAEGASQMGQEARGRNARPASTSYPAHEQRQVKADLSRELLQAQYEGP